MQHVRRCWERQSDGSEYKKTLRRPGLRPGPPSEGTYSAPANALVGGEGLAVPSPRTPPPHSRPFGPRLFYPHSKISSDAHDRNSSLCNCDWAHYGAMSYWKTLQMVGSNSGLTRIVGSVDLCIRIHKNLRNWARKCVCHSWCEHLEAQTCCKLLGWLADVTR